MTKNTAIVRIWAPRTEEVDRGAVTRIYTADFALVGEAASGEALEVPVGDGYVATAVGLDGQALSLPERFNLASTEAPQEVFLKPRPGKEQAPSTPQDSGVETWSAALRSNLGGTEIQLVALEPRSFPSALPFGLSTIKGSGEVLLNPRLGNERAHAATQNSEAETWSAAVRSKLDWREIQPVSLESKNFKFADRRPLPPGAGLGPLQGVSAAILQSKRKRRIGIGAMRTSVVPTDLSGIEIQLVASETPGLSVEPWLSMGQLPAVAVARRYLIFPGPGGRRYAVIPFDSKHGEWIAPRIRWSAAKTEGYALPNFEFDSPQLAALQEALRHRQTMLACGLASRSQADTAEEAVSGKLESALAAALGGLLLLQEAPERLQAIEPWTRALFEHFPWLPDVLPLRADLLAKVGRHRDAQEVLRLLPARGVPWTRLGLRVLAERLHFYSQLERHDDALANWSQSAQRLLAINHPACVFCVFEEASSTSPNER